MLNGLTDKTWLAGQLSKLCSAGTISSAFNSTRHSNCTGCVFTATGALLLLCTIHEKSRKNGRVPLTEVSDLIRILLKYIMWSKGLFRQHIFRPWKYIRMKFNLCMYCTFTHAHIFSLKTNCNKQFRNDKQRAVSPYLFLLQFTANTVWQDNLLTGRFIQPKCRQPDHKTSSSTQTISEQFFKKITVWLRSGKQYFI